MLWTAPSIGFYPHCRAADKLAPVTPIIVDHMSDPMVHDEVLINLRDETPSMFSRFRRLIEIVSTDEADRTAARERFRFYRDRGYEIRTHQLGSESA
jgi:DNA polymerase-3 subunit chi